MYLYSNISPSPADWAFDTFHDGSKISYYLGAFYQSFLLIVGNYQVRCRGRGGEGAGRWVMRLLLHPWHVPSIYMLLLTLRPLCADPPE